MSTKSLREAKKKLEARKSKIEELVKGIEEHEHEVEEYATRHAKFQDPKYASSGSFSEYAYSGKSSDDFSDSADASDDIKRMLEGGSDSQKKKGKTKSTAGVGGTSKGEAKKPASKKKKTATVIPMTESGEPRRGKGSKKGGKGKGSKKAGTFAALLPEPEVTQSELSAEEKTLAERKLSTTSMESTDTRLDIDEDDDDESIDEEIGIQNILNALRCFANAKYIFLQRLMDNTAVQAAGLKKKNKVEIEHQILNVEGQLLFLMQQRKARCTGFIVYAKKSFVNILYDISGNKVLKYIGPSVLMSRMHSNMVVTDAQDRLLGYIKAFGTKVNYSVYNAVGERLFLVVSNLYLPTNNTDFSIIFKGQKIGVIRYGWKHTFHDLDYIDYETSGIEFPSDMDEREKALLLGCLMLIEFFWYSPLTRLKLSLLFAGIFLLSLACIILFIPIIIDNPADDGKTKSYYIAEKLAPPKKIEDEVKDSQLR